MLCIKYGNDHVGVLGVTTAFEFLLLALLECLNVFRGCFLVLSAFLSNNAAIIIVFLADLLHFSHCCLGNLAIALEFLRGVDCASLCRFFSLSQKHLPLPDIIHGLILV